MRICVYVYKTALDKTAHPESKTSYARYNGSRLGLGNLNGTQ